MTSVVDFQAVKARQQAMWASGDYAEIGKHLTLVGELLCEAVDPYAGQRVLDVATGNGSTALSAARRGCEVTGIDYVPAQLENGRTRAAAEHLQVQFQEGDAEALPYENASFDIVLSTFGVMFAPSQEQAARELLRVCRPGGKIGLANWTPESFAGKLIEAVGNYLPPLPGVISPLRWGTDKGLRELFGDSIASLSITQRFCVFRYRSAQHWLDHYRTYFGPTYTAFQMLNEEGQARLSQDILAVLHRFNRAGDASLVVPSEYIEVVIERV